MSVCCEYCFNDDYLQDHIRQNGTVNDCDFCGKTSVPCIEPAELREMFEPLVNLYKPVEDFMPLHDLKKCEGDFIWEKLNDDWQLFEMTYEKQEDLLKEMFDEPRDKHNICGPQFLQSFVESEAEYWGVDIEYNERLKKHWDEFREEIMYGNRYFPTRALDTSLLETVIPYFEQFIPANEILYRGRISDDGVKILPSHMGKPTSAKSKNGRANPVGISYLYVASDIDTVVAEIRPAFGDKITAGEFKTVSRLRVVDLRNPRIDSPFKYGHELEHVLSHVGFMRILGTELSKLIDPEVKDIEYVPTQYLCEFIKNIGYDGVIYKSSVGTGHNLAIFNDHKIQCISSNLYLVEKDKYVLI